LLPGTSLNVPEQPSIGIAPTSEDLATPEVTTSNYQVKCQGDQTKLSKIDRFMGRSAAAVNVVAPLPEATPKIGSADKIQPTVDFIINEKQVKFDLEDKSLLKERKSPPSALSQLDILKTLCPTDRKECYETLVNLLRSNDPFYQSLIELLPSLTSGQRCMIINFLQN
jgi:hypothetical protein